MGHETKPGITPQTDRIGRLLSSRAAIKTHLTRDSIV